MENRIIEDLKKYFETKLNEIVTEQRNLYKKHEENVGLIISNNLKIINQRLDALTEEIRTNKTDINDLKHEVDDLKNSIQYNEHTLEDKIKKVSENMEKNRTELCEKLRTLEDRNRRNNLRIEGMTENRNETWEDTTEKVQKIFKNKLGVENVEIERAHRTGERKGEKPRSIVLKLLRYQDKEKILKERKKLKGSDIYVNEDFSRETMEIRRNLREEIKRRHQKDDEILIVRYDKIVKIKKRNLTRQNDSTQ